MAGRRKPRVPRMPRAPVNTPIGTNIFVPNHSGDHQAGRMLRTPENDYDLVNKKYVDDSIPSTENWQFTIIDPKSVYGKDTHIFIGWATTDITVTRVQVELDATTNQVAGDLKYADDFINLSNAVVINDFDTTSGVRDDNSITSPSVSNGKAIYIQFDSEPHENIKQMHFRMTFTK